MKRAVAAAFLLLLACGGVESPPPPPGLPKKTVIIPPPSDEAERSSIVNIAYGSVVVSRTGEALLETSAMAAIDGDPATAWQNAAGDFPESLVVALAARTRIEKVGMRTPSKISFLPKDVVFETSIDGRTFQPLATLAAKKVSEAQWLDVRPTDAAFLRVTVPAPAEPNGGVSLSAILARGRELEPPHPGAIDGCWRVNGRATTFATHGAHTRGAMQYAHDVLLLDGGSNGRIHRFEWIRGPEFGYAAFAVAPDRQHLNGIQWHEEIVALFFGDAWFGDPVECGGHAVALTAAADVAHEFLKRTGRHSLYSLRFANDGTFDAAASADGLKSLVALLRETPNARLVAHEFRERTAEANRARAKRALDSLAKALQNAGVEPSRVTFVAAGSDDARQIPGSEAARELFSSVDLEVGR
jgi:hypothetical protein